LSALFILACLVLAMAFCPQLKRGPRPKKSRKPIPSRGPLKRRAVWARNIPATQETLNFAARCREQNLLRANNCPVAQSIIAAIRANGWQFDQGKHQEVVHWFDGNRFVISDFIVPGARLIIEADGLHHRQQHIYDWQKDKLVEEMTGYKTLRRWNRWFLEPNLAARLGAFAEKPR
jgi:very-short-patch-repair endonuclease